MKIFTRNYNIMLEINEILSRSPDVLNTNSTSPNRCQTPIDSKVGNTQAINMSELLSRDLLRYEELDHNGRPRSPSSEFTTRVERKHEVTISEQLNYLQNEIKNINSKISDNLEVLEMKQEKNNELKERIRTLNQNAGVDIITDESSDNQKACSCNSHCSIA